MTMSIIRNPSVHVYGLQRDLQREMNRLLDNFFPTTPKRTSEDTFESAVWRPVVDLHEDGNSYVIDAELPGLTRDDVKISFQEGTLTISGERNYRYEKKEGEDAPEADGGVRAKERTAHRMERIYGKFLRSFTFPSAVNAEAISARFDNGVLTITVPKADAVKPRQIEIG
jgi:HSP20 family protein